MALTEESLQKEYNILIEEKWIPYFNQTYDLKVKSNVNRTKFKSIIGIKQIKEYIIQRIGYISVFIFLTSFCNTINIPGPYNNIEKCLLVLFFLLKGHSAKDMCYYTDTLTGSSFYNIFESIFIKNGDKLELFIDDIIFNAFSNEKIRLLTSYIKNPDIFKHVTLFMDGHHNKITLEDIDIEKNELYSYKLKRNGLNTQFVIDCNDICLYISESLPCKFNNDDNMFLNNVNLSKFMRYSDCLCFDGLYENTVNEVIEKYNNIGMNIEIHNFCYPIRKDRKIALTDDEIYFNNNLGSFRSRIETYFANLCNKFQRIDAQTNIRVTKVRIYNLQLKLCVLLNNIHTFYEINKTNINFNNNYYKLWVEDNFDYYDKNKTTLVLNKLSNKTEYKIENINERYLKS